MDIGAQLVVGDRVRIAKDSAFYTGGSKSDNPRDVDGEVIKIVQRVHYQVIWDNGKHNWYLSPDLVSIGCALWT